MEPHTVAVTYEKSPRTHDKNMLSHQTGPAVEMLHSLKQWLSTWQEGRANLGSSGACNALNDQRGWSQDPSLPRPHLRVGSGGEKISLEIPAYGRSFRGKQFFFLCFCVQGCYTGACSHLLQPRIVPLCYCCCTFHHIIALYLITASLLFCVHYLMPARMSYCFGCPCQWQTGKRPSATWSNFEVHTDLSKSLNTILSSISVKSELHCDWSHELLLSHSSDSVKDKPSMSPDTV